MEFDRTHTGPSSPPSLKHKIRSSICFSCCFRVADDVVDGDERPPPSLIRSSSTWIRSKAQELPEVKDRCISLVNRIGKHRRPGSGGFRYDPLSYALNFDDGPDDDDALADDGFRYRNFSSRLPASPPPPPPSATAVGVSCS